MADLPATPFATWLNTACDVGDAGRFMAAASGGDDLFWFVGVRWLGFDARKGRWVRSPLPVLSEPPPGVTLSPALMKTWTTGAPISARDLHAKPISFRPTQPLVWECKPLTVRQRLRLFVLRLRRRWVRA